MIKPLFRTAACGSFLALAACGGGSTGGGGDDLSLDTKADALRELGVAASLIADLPDPLPPAAPAAAAKKIGELPDFGRADGDCSEAGTSVVTAPGNKTRNFSLLGQANVGVSFQREVSTACISAATAPSPRTATLRYDGIFERGSSGTLEDGSRVGYIVDGNGGAEGYLATYLQRLSGQPIDTQLQARIGTIEKRVTAAGAVDLRAIYGQSFDREDASGSRPVRSYTVVKLGTSGAPFRYQEDGDEISFNGPYEYAAPECSGGAATLATEEPIRLNTAEYPVDGKLRITVGSQSAVFEFNSESGAMLNLNGTTMPLTAAEVRAKLDQPPC